MCNQMLVWQFSIVIKDSSVVSSQTFHQLLAQLVQLAACRFVYIVYLFVCCVHSLLAVISLWYCVDLCTFMLSLFRSIMLHIFGHLFTAMYFQDCDSSTSLAIEDHCEISHVTEQHMPHCQSIQTPKPPKIHHMRRNCTCHRKSTVKSSAQPDVS